MADWTQEEKLNALNVFEQKYADLRKQEITSRAPAELLYHSMAIDLQCEVTALREALEELVDGIEDGGGTDGNGDTFDITKACKLLTRIPK